MEEYNIFKPSLLTWKQGQKGLSHLKCIKSKHGKKVEEPQIIQNDTLYIPFYSSGIFVLRQLRNAFCHNALKYESSARQYRISLTDKVKITGRFSLKGINDFFNAFLKVTNKS